MKQLLLPLGALVLALIACGELGEANAGSRSGYQTYSARAGYPRPGCTVAIREYPRRWPYQLWPPGMLSDPRETRPYQFVTISASWSRQ
jgi:hypothetical protein